MRFADLEGQTVGVCLSGNLASLAAAAWLSRSGLTVVAAIADIGQAEPGRLRALAAALTERSLPAQVVDLRGAMARMGIDLVRYRARYDGGYWNTTSASRWVLVAGLSRLLREAGCTVLAHGSVDGGNDQQRFTRYVAAHGHGLSALSVWALPELRAALPDRDEMLRFLASTGLTPVPVTAAASSVDVNLTGASYEGVALEDLANPASPVTRHFGAPPQDAPDRVETVTVRVERGRPTAVNGVAGTALDCLLAANDIAARNGIGLRDVVENRLNGTKCRGVYEAPGLELLDHAVRAACEATVDKPADRLLDVLARTVGDGVYEGRYQDPATRAACAAIDVIVDHVAATVQLQVYKGAVVARALTDVAAVPWAARQTRFAAGGHNWTTAAAVPAAAPPALPVR